METVVPPFRIRVLVKFFNLRYDRDMIKMPYSPVYALIFATFLCIPQVVLAEKNIETKTSLSEFVSALKFLVANHNDVVAANHDTKRLQFNYRAISKSRYPNLAIKSSIGKEDQVKPAAQNTLLNPRDLNLTLTMPVFDKSLHHSIEQIELTVKQGEQVEKATFDRVLLEGISAQINISSSIKILEFAAKSVANIRKQTELENARVIKGSGFTSDFLQAKAQLAGAEARKTQAQIGLQLATNRYVAVFKTPPPTIHIPLGNIPFPRNSMPKDIESAVNIAILESPQLNAQQTALDIAVKSVDVAKANNIFPKLSFIFETKYKQDFGGTIGFSRDSIAKLELIYNFNTAGAGFDTFRVANNARIATAKRFDQSRIIITEQVKNTWSQFELAKKNAEFLMNQTTIAEEFLRLARKEQSLGSRSLLDVLAGETAYINAATDSFAAQALVLASAYTLLGTIGRLDIDVIKN